MDMDGTLYNGDELIPGAEDFLRFLKNVGKRSVFMTNNSSRSRFAYVEKLARLGIESTVDDIASSVNATSCYLKEHYGDTLTIYLVGTESLRQELLTDGFHIVPADYEGDEVNCVLVGYDTELNYRKLERACHFLCEGALFYATNCDLRCPIEGGRYLPDCATICNMLEVSTGRKPRYLGKPDRYIVDYVHAKWGADYEDMVVVGDRLYTDIAVGANAGIDSICVLTGESTLADIDASEVTPTYIFNSIKDVYEILKS